MVAVRYESSLKLSQFVYICPVRILRQYYWWSVDPSDKFCSSIDSAAFLVTVMSMAPGSPSRYGVPHVALVLCVRTWRSSIGVGS